MYVYIYIYIYRERERIINIMNINVVIIIYYIIKYNSIMQYNILSRAALAADKDWHIRFPAVCVFICMYIYIYI